jgi:hypothetical protein
VEIKINLYNIWGRRILFRSETLFKAKNKFPCFWRIPVSAQALYHRKALVRRLIEQTGETE